MLSRKSMTRQKKDIEKKENLSLNLIPNLKKVCEHLLYNEYCKDQDMQWEVRSIDFFAFNS